MQIEKYINSLLTKMQRSENANVSAAGFLLGSMRREYTDAIGTMAVDGVTFFVNPTWCLTRYPIVAENTAANLFTMFHEAMHVFGRHPERLADCMPHNRDLVHKAADYSINLTAVQERIPYPMPDDGLFDASFVDDNGKALNAERIVHLLAQQPEQPEQPGDMPVPGEGADVNPGDGSQSGDDTGDGSDSDTGDGSEAGDGDDTGDDTATDQDNGSSSGTGTGDGTGASTEDNGSTPESCGELLPAPSDMDRREATQNIVAAVELAEKSTGHAVCDALKDLVHDALVDCETDWLSELHDKFANAIAADDYSDRKLADAYLCIGMVEPTLYSDGIGKVAIVGDESSSMSDEELAVITKQTAEIISQWQPQEVLIVRHTSEIEYTETLYAGQEPTARKKRAHGGTDFMPVIDLVEAESCEVVIWITDCFPCDDPREAGVPVIWLGTSYGSRDAWSRYLDYGDFVSVLGE